MDAPPQILVVDDEPDVRTLTAMILEAWGYRVVSASSVREALDASRENTFDAVVTDIGLGERSGFDLARELKDSLGERAPRVVAVTGRDSTLAAPGDDLELFDRYLVKPIEPFQLRAALDDVLA